MEMIERVAQAIHESLGYETPWETCSQCHDAARAAIEAMMEPTLAMRKVCSFETAEVEYPAMIRSALEEGK